MKVRELIEKLKAMPQDLEVYGYCDRGQSPEQVSYPSVAYTGELGQCLWDEWTCLDEEDSEYTEQFVLL